MRRAAGACAVVLLVAAGMLWGGAAAQGGSRAARHGVRLVDGRGKTPAGRWQEWANASRMPTPRARVRLRLGRCPALPRAAGCVYTRHPRTIWILPTAGDPRGTLLHELGHTFDLLVMNNRERAGVKRIFHRSGRSWWKGRIPTAEWFAEGYSWCARYARIASLRRYASYRYRPTAAQHRKLCAAIRRVARGHVHPQPAPATPPTTRSDPPPAPPPSNAPGTVPGDPQHDPGPTQPSNPNPAPSPTRTPIVPLPPVPTLVGGGLES